MKRVMGIFVCMLLIATSISVVGIESKPFNNGVKWVSTFGGEEVDMGFCAQETSDGGYIVVGTTCSFGNGEEDIWLIKTDYMGRHVWEKFYGGQYDEFASDVKETSDGGYIIIGESETFTNGKDDLLLIKVDGAGEVIWQKNYGGFNFDGGSEVIETSDGGYIVLGSVDHTGGPRGDIWLIKTDADGNILWDKKFGGIGHNHGGSIDLTNDGGYIISGASFISGETESYDFWIIKTDEAGEVIWDKKIHENSADFAWHIKHTSDGGYIVVGDANYDYPYCNILLLKLDSNGEILWDSVFSNFGYDQRAFCVRETNDGGFIIAGCTYLNNIFGFNALIIKTDDLGNELWSKYNPKIGNEIVTSVEQTLDEGFIFTGYITKGTDVDLWLIKTDSEGKTVRNRVITNSFLMRLFERFPNAFPILRQILL